MPAIKAYDLRTKSTDDLSKQLADLKHELSTLRVQAVAGAENATKSRHIRTVRKAIARTLTIVTEKQRGAAKAQYAGAKRLPTDLRAKKTRAMRKALTKKEAGLKTLRQKKREIHYPKLQFILKP